MAIVSPYQDPVAFYDKMSDRRAGCLCVLDVKADRGNTVRLVKGMVPMQVPTVAIVWGGRRLTEVRIERFSFDEPFQWHMGCFELERNGKPFRYGDQYAFFYKPGTEPKF